jgi:bacterioferritin-associated ferredoxin
MRTIRSYSRRHDANADADADAAALPPPPARPRPRSARVIVCVCRRVSDHQIRQAAAGGVATFDELQMELGVATQCGRCADCACDVLARARCAEAASHGHGRGHAGGAVVAWLAQPRAALAAQPA